MIKKIYVIEAFYPNLTPRWIAQFSSHTYASFTSANKACKRKQHNLPSIKFRVAEYTYTDSWTPEGLPNA